MKKNKKIILTTLGSLAIGSIAVASCLSVISCGSQQSVNLNQNSPIDVNVNGNNVQQITAAQLAQATGDNQITSSQTQAVADIMNIYQVSPSFTGYSLSMNTNANGQYQ